MRKIIIDGQEWEMDPGLALIQACEEAGAEIPRFCYHERLSVAGNCRMCLVEVVGAPKPMASCAVTVGDLRGGRNGEPPEVKTSGDVVEKARKGVMEFLLINHPLDCPICDQGGECDLQDQAVAFGGDSSRYELNKRAVENKFMGPLIKTTMTRCIHCTRCVRFSTEVAGVPEIGAIGRGEAMEITSYLEQAVTNELSGNVIDLCPVGALTSKPYAFKSRPWELTKTNSIDVMDALGSHIRVDSRGNEVLRFLPRTNDWVNEEWLSDKGRFVWDGLTRQRLDRPYVRINGRLVESKWEHALSQCLEMMKGKKTHLFAGDLVSMDTLFAAKKVFGGREDVVLEIRLHGENFDPSEPSSYLFGPSVAGVDDADGVIFVGANPRKQAPVLNARIRKRWLDAGIPVASFGEEFDATYPMDVLGQSVQDFLEFAKNPSDQFMGLGRLLVIISPDALSGPDVGLLASGAKKLAAHSLDEQWNGFAVLQNHASMVGGLMMGFVGDDGPTSIKDKTFNADDLVFLMGVDEFTRDEFGDAQVVYMGSHGDLGASSADLILPVAAWTEEDGYFANTEGRVQLARQAVQAPGEARAAWKVFRALASMIGADVSFDDHVQLVGLMAEEGLLDRHREYGALSNPAPIPTPLEGTAVMPERVLSCGLSDHFLSNAVARASETMAECARLRLLPQDATGTEG